MWNYPVGSCIISNSIIHESIIIFIGYFLLWNVNFEVVIKRLITEHDGLIAILL
jgi:hypothetical protein